jgi:sec-independent protein translocase protein TatB
MFDFAWSEIALIGVVALIAIGPKDMPVAIRTVSSFIKKARRMAAEFQSHVDEMMREADLGDVKKAFNEIRNFDLPTTLEKHIDPDRSLRNTFESDPFKPAYPPPGPAPAEVSTLDEVAVSAPPLPEPEPAPAVAIEPPKPEAPAPGAPAWVPPGMVPPPKPQAAAPEAPAFIPPAAVLQHRRKA